MTTIAFLYPGQGSQCTGMGLDFVSAYPQAKDWYEAAESVLGWPVLDLSKPEGAEQIGVTLYTQPALYTISCIISEILKSAGLKPSAAAGHSAGEYAALYMAGVWDFETGLRIIAERARLMHHCNQPGAMAAVVGMEAEKLLSLCAEWKDGFVQIANYNSPKQIVISGEEKGIEAITPWLKEQGARRVIKLNVSGAFHSPLMKDAQVKFASFMKTIPLQAPDIPWISNNTADVVTDPESIRDLLVRQFCEPVRWTASMQWIETHCAKAIETGPGSVLKGLASACCKNLPCETTATVDGVRKVLQENGLSA